MPVGGLSSFRRLIQVVKAKTFPAEQTDGRRGVSAPNPRRASDTCFEAGFCSVRQCVVIRPDMRGDICGAAEGVLTVAVDWKSSRSLPNEVIALPPWFSSELFPDFPVPLSSPAAPGPVRVRNGSGPLHPEEGQTLTFATRASGP